MAERKNNTTHRRGVALRSAEARRCPLCGRGAALVSVTPRPSLPGEVTTYCRWDDCPYARVVPDRDGWGPAPAVDPEHHAERYSPDLLPDRTNGSER